MHTSSVHMVPKSHFKARCIQRCLTLSNTKAVWFKSGQRTGVDIYPNAGRWLVSTWNAQRHSRRGDADPIHSDEPLLPVRTATIKNRKQAWRGCGELGTLIYCWRTRKMGQLPWEMVWSFLRQLQIELLCVPANSTSGFVPKRIEGRVSDGQMPAQPCSQWLHSS